MSPPAIPRRDDAGVPELVEEIRERIRREGPLRFDAFMSAALYHPRHGYYTRGLAAGARDFQTSPQVHPAFGELIGRQVLEMHRRLGAPESFRVVELGPGDGLLAASLAPALISLPGEWEYHLVESSPGLREVQQRELVRLPEPLRARLRWSEPAVLEADPRCGVVVANEFFDALPVRRLRQEGELSELRITLDEEGNLQEVAAPADAEVRAWVARYGAPLAAGTEAETSPEALSWIDRIGRLLQRGYAIIIDYGDRAEGLFGSRRPAGTVLAYHRHRSAGDLLCRVGDQDITAHVNFTALALRAEENGLQAAPLRSQAEFLVALGILERLPDPGGPPRGAAGWRESLALKELFSPDRMGESFRVLVLAKESALDDLAGLASPWRLDLDRIRGAT